MVNVLNFLIVVNVFELQSGCDIHFQINTLWKFIFSPQLWLSSISIIFRGLPLNNS